MRCTVGWLGGLLCCLASGALAAPVAIVNPGFEDGLVGWTASGSQSGPPRTLTYFVEIPRSNEGSYFVAYASPTVADSGVYQDVALDDWAGAIDAGEATATCGGWLYRSEEHNV